MIRLVKKDCQTVDRAKFRCKAVNGGSISLNTLCSIMNTMPIGIIKRIPFTVVMDKYLNTRWIVFIIKGIFYSLFHEPYRKETSVMKMHCF
jgi:hypothetical protein